MLEIAPPFAHTSGPKDAKIVFVGEAHGEQEQLTGLPFIGSSGQELTRMMTEAGLVRSQYLLTNVLARRPDPSSNNLDFVCGDRLEVGKQYPYPPLKTQGKRYLREEFFPELDRLKAELEVVRPNLIVALGNTACWALLGCTGIGSIRGTISPCKLVEGLKVLPTYHPQAVVKQWNLRTVVLADLMKAKREADFPEIRRPRRLVTVNPTIGDIEEFYYTYITKAKFLGTDIETGAGQIKMIGFAPSKERAIVIPFVDPKKKGYSYWEDFSVECIAWDWVQKYLEAPGVKLFQNGMYDLQFLAKMALKPSNCTEDTMLLHHSLYPEMRKGLGFLGSIYTDEPAWKLMRGKTTTEEFKRDE